MSNRRTDSTRTPQARAEAIARRAARRVKYSGRLA
jgi:hypothetical protein